jgi:hypothetical protein
MESGCSTEEEKMSGFRSTEIQLWIAESKSDRFPCKINGCSEKTGKFAPKSVNSLAAISEWPAERTHCGAVVIPPDRGKVARRTVEHSLGKGEVVSSILTGSTK